MITHVFSARRALKVGLVLAATASASGLALAQGTNSSAGADTSTSGAVTNAATSPVATVPAAPVLSPEAIALRTALEQRLGRNSTALTAYAGNAFRPIWTSPNGKLTVAGQTLLSVLAKAADHALPASRYGAAALTSRASSAGTNAAAYEADLAKAYLTYAKDVTSGLLNPRSIDRELHIDPEVVDPGDLIRRAASTPDMAAYLDSLPPQDPIYRRLVERYAAFRTLGATDLWGAPVSKGRTMRPGERSQRVAQVRARLTAMGDLDPNVYDTPTAEAKAADGTQVAANDVATDVPVLAFEPTLFDDQMVTALQSFQARHGLNLDGVIGPATLRQINTSPATRAEQIAVNLERMRWMNRDLGQRHILVNLAGFTMDVMNNGKSEFSQRVVIGKAKEHRTPEFSDEMTHMVINPSWYVPTSIKGKEILPKLAKNPNYLVNRNMRMVNGRIIQAPGPRNALGTVKFMFPNRFAIYLHDTPSKRLFKRDVRAYSHGCVRVERPHEFAAFLLSAQRENAEGYFQSILKRRKERRVNLEQPLPVHLTYRSAWIDENGVEQFRGDVYGRDRKIAAALKSSGVSIVN